MAHHNPKACEDYCCWNCTGTLLSNPCGIYWFAGFGRVINALDEVVATGSQGSLQVPTGTYRLQVQCSGGAEWTTVDEVDHVADETMCNCCDIMEPYQSHTLSNLDHLTSDCFELPATLTFPTKFGYDWTGNVIATPCSSSYRIYSPVTPIVGAANVQAAACWTGSYLGDTYWVALWYAFLSVDVVYATFGTSGSFAAVHLYIAYFLTDGATVSTNIAQRKWRSQIACPPWRDFVLNHLPSEDLGDYPPWVGVTTENLILNTDL